MRTATLIAAATITVSSILLLGRPSITFATSRSAELRDAAGSDDAMEKQIISKEREGLDALKTGDLERFGELTADEAVMVDAHGPASKAQVLKNVTAFRLTDYSMEDMQFVHISANTGLISYKITEKGVSHEKEFTAQAYVSSLWTERGKQWVCLFSQETAAR